MAPLVPYPAKPSKGETNGYDKLEAYDEAVQENIQAAYDLAAGSVDAETAKQKFTEIETAVGQRATTEYVNQQRTELENDIGAKADRSEVKTAINTSNDALFQAGQKVNIDDKAGLNEVGWAPAIYIARDAEVPAVPPFTQIIRLPAV